MTCAAGTAVSLRDTQNPGLSRTGAPWLFSTVNHPAPRRRATRRYGRLADAGSRLPPLTGRAVRAEQQPADRPTEAVAFARSGPPLCNFCDSRNNAAPGRYTRDWIAIANGRSLGPERLDAFSAAATIGLCDLSER